MQKKVPLRMCIGCLEMKPKKELLRIIKNQDGQIIVDKTGKANGRGAYVCNNLECIDKLRKSNKILKTFEINPEENFYDSLKEEINNID